MKKFYHIFLNAVPILLMIGLIPFVSNDYTLTLLYIAIIIVGFALKWMPNDVLIFTFGFVAMIVSEYLFIGTGVETFNRNTLFGLMPLWLPFLWGYGFVAIKRSVEIL
ncbi:MAG: hypothetical protein NUV90_00750 [Candidatus Parcubacteria bacterium]|nr:hypothetical protein [Candidatus Parcubacteria bacterium]